MTRLVDSVFKTVIANTPLVSIDLVIFDENNRVLLGKRINKPAQGFWFVPGGRIRKNETLLSAFERICESELDCRVDFESAVFHGLYEHMYDDGVFDQVSTHYVVLSYVIKTEKLINLPMDQHSSFSWFEASDLLENDDVHQYTKNYFIK